MLQSQPPLLHSRSHFVLDRPQVALWPLCLHIAARCGFVREHTEGEAMLSQYFWRMRYGGNTAVSICAATSVVCSWSGISSFALLAGMSSSSSSLCAIFLCRRYASTHTDISSVRVSFDLYSHLRASKVGAAQSFTTTKDGL